MRFAATDNRPIGGDRIAAGEALTDTLPESRGRPHRFCRSELAYPKTAGGGSRPVAPPVPPHYG
ncbi:hypothetical protein AJ88_38685 [Mesorhizobium amorphae CCBAU 01583]|nr:hypothetical protein AJ88_38685 [Mesorhizobium amorphae CCBAU 01583]